MSTNDLSAYKDLYIKTAHDYLEAMHASMMLLAADKSNQGALETLYRSGHSLKTQSMLMGYKNTASICHYIEATFRNVQEGKDTLSDKIYTETLEAIDKIDQSLESIEKLDKEITLGEQVTN